MQISFRLHARLPNGERESEVIPRDIQDKLDKIKENFHDLEGTIRQQRLYLTSLSLQQVSNNEKKEEVTLNFTEGQSSTEGGGE